MNAAAAITDATIPEHTSGHSVISTAAGETLTVLFGEDFAYTDDVEVEYGLAKRTFGSFREAYQEAAMSRLYGRYSLPAGYRLRSGRGQTGRRLYLS